MGDRILSALGMGPLRYAKTEGTDHVRAFVTAGYVGAKEVSVLLTNNQYLRYVSWINGGLMIQEALSDVSVREREMLLSGIDPQNSKVFAPEE